MQAKASELQTRRLQSVALNQIQFTPAGPFYQLWTRINSLSDELIVHLTSHGLRPEELLVSMDFDGTLSGRMIHANMPRNSMEYNAEKAEQEIVACHFLRELDARGIAFIINTAASSASQVRHEMKARTYGESQRPNMLPCSLFDDTEEILLVDYTKDQPHRGVIHVQRAGCVFSAQYDKDASIHAAIELLLTKLNRPSPRLVIHVDDGAMNCVTVLQGLERNVFHAIGVYYPPLPGVVQHPEPYEEEAIQILRDSFVQI
jgi:hypothetical protein